MKSPKYFLAAFGKTELPDKDTADSGRYHLGKRGPDTPGERGDVMLLYRTADDEGGTMNAPGIGIILTKTREYIFYRHLPFSSPIPKDRLETAFTDEDRDVLNGIPQNTYWLYDLSGESFVKASRDVSIDWPLPEAE